MIFSKISANWHISTLAYLLLLFACKTSQPQPDKPMEQYNVLPPESKISTINIPVKINIKAFQKSLNTQLNGMLYEDKDIKDGDKMMVRAEKLEDIQINVKGQTIQYKVPLKLWIRYDIGITEVEANGDIALKLKTDFKIKDDWTLETTTDIESYDWLKQPKLKLVGVNLPVGFIADMVLKNSKKTLTRSIDGLVKDSFDLRKMVSDSWNKLFDPILIAPEYNTWLLVNPQTIGMTALVTRGDSLSSTIFVETRPKINLGEKPARPNPTPLPPYKIKDVAQDDFTLIVSTDVPYKEAERLAKAQLEGETFTEGKRTVKIEDMKLYGQGNQLIVNTKLSGSYNGNIYLTGKPFYNPTKNIVEIRDLNFTLETRSFLLKSAAWLLKGTLRKRIEDNLQFLLDYNITALKKQLQQQLTDYKISSNIFLTGQLNELNIQDAFLAPSSIRVEIVLKGRVNLEVNGLN